MIITKDLNLIKLFPDIFMKDNKVINEVEPKEIFVDNKYNFKYEEVVKEGKIEITEDLFELTVLPSVEEDDKREEIWWKIKDSDYEVSNHYRVRYIVTGNIVKPFRHRYTINVNGKSVNRTAIGLMSLVET